MSNLAVDDHQYESRKSLQRSADALEEARTRLEVLKFETQARFSRDKQTYVIDGTEATGTVLVDTDFLEIILLEFPEGAEMAKHWHGFSDQFVMLTGEFQIKTEGREITLKNREAYLIEPYISHSVKALKNSKLLLIRSPSSRDFRENGREPKATT